MNKGPEEHKKLMDALSARLPSYSDSVAQKEDMEGLLICAEI